MSNATKDDLVVALEVLEQRGVNMEMRGLLTHGREGLYTVKPDALLAALNVVLSRHAHIEITHRQMIPIEVDIERKLAAVTHEDKPEQNKALRDFLHWTLSNGPFNNYDVDATDVIDKAEELGLITKEEYDPKRHGGNNTNDVELGDDWYVFAPGIA